MLRLLKVLGIHVIQTRLKVFSWESEYVSILFANRWVQKELRSYKNLFYPLESIIRLGFMKHPTSSFNVSGHRKLKSRSPQEVQKSGEGEG